MKSVNHFNIRVYGLFINDRNQILIADEFVLNRYMTKFPGGGLEFGEGPVDCLRREAREEMGQEIEVISHYYTTDYFQKALFYEDTQLISIYYLAQLTQPDLLNYKDKPLDIPKIEGSMAFRWVNIEDLENEDLSFPIDRLVGKLLKQTF